VRQRREGSCGWACGDGFSYGRLEQENVQDAAGDKTWVKICGIRRVADLVVAAEEGADAVGLVFDRSSPRAVAIEEARQLVSIAGHDILCVGVFRNEPATSVAVVIDEVGLDAIQYYGDVAEFVAIKRSFPELRLATFAVPVRSDRANRLFRDVLAGFEGEEERPDVLLFDSSKPGSGRPWRWSALADYFGPIPFVLAGGLNPDNVIDAISTVHPWGVDVSSSLEVRPGVKDPALVRKFVAAVRLATKIRETVDVKTKRLYERS